MTTTISGSSAERLIMLPRFGTAMIFPNISAHGVTLQVLFTRPCLTQFMRIFPIRILRILTARFGRNTVPILVSLPPQAAIRRPQAGTRKTMFQSIARVTTIHRTIAATTRKKKNQQNQISPPPPQLLRQKATAASNRIFTKVKQ